MASAGKSLATLLVSGTTCIRLRWRLDMSLLTITAGRLFWISPPRDGSKSTHHTSPRFIGHVSDQCLDPLEGLRLRSLVSSHLGVPSFHVLRNDVGSHQFLDELADPSGPDDAVQSVVDPLVHADRQLLLHDSLLLYVQYTYNPPRRKVAPPSPRHVDDLVAPGAHGDVPDGDAGQLLQPPQVGVRIRRQVFPAPRVRRALAPAGERLVRGDGVFQQRQVAGEVVERLAAGLVAGGDLQLRQPVEHVELGDGEAG